jgi:hypothetical protein
MQNKVPRGISRSVKMPKSKLEKVLEYMVNGEKELASEMLHEHLIETARDIYAELAEEDDMVEEELDLDEDEDEELEEGLHDDDESGDFSDDLESMEDELETEEYFGEEEDDEDEAMDDLEGDMDMDMDMDDEGDMDMDMDMDDEMDDEGGDDVEDAMVNVEDAMDELRAAFADLVGDEMDDEEGDEVADEFDDMDLEDGDDDEDLEDDDLEEGATLSKHNVTMAGDEDGKASPLKQNQPNISSHGKAVDKFGGDEKGGKGDSAKKMSVTGPQEQKGKMDKKVSNPSNSSEKAHSLFKDKNKH